MALNSEQVRCERDRTHATGMEWIAVDGIRLGQLGAYCYDCDRWLPRSESEDARRVTLMREVRECQRRQDERRRASDRVEEIVARRRAGEKAASIAADLGVTPQRIWYLARWATSRRAG